MMSRGRTESLEHRAGLPPGRLLPLIFIRDQAAEKLEELALCGLLILTPWAKRIGVASEAGHSEIVAAVVNRLMAERGRIARSCWVEPAKITPAAFEFDWLRRQIADHATLAVRLPDDGAGDQVCNGFATSRVRVACGRLEPAA